MIACRSLCYCMLLNWLVVYVDVLRKKDVWKHFIHNFPKHLLQRQKWIEFMSISNWQPLTNSKLCFKHFTPDCFDISGITRLKSMAVPTIYLTRFQHVRFAQEQKIADEAINSRMSVIQTAIPQIMDMSTINVEDKEEIDFDSNVTCIANRLNLLGVIIQRKMILQEKVT